MIRKKFYQQKIWMIVGIAIISMFFISLTGPIENNLYNHVDFNHPEAQADNTYYRWGTTWGGKNVDQANDVWAYGQFSYVVGTLDVNTSNPKLILSCYFDADWWRGEQYWNVTWTNGANIYGNAVWGNYNASYIYTAGTSSNDLILIKWDRNGNEIWNSSWSLAGNYGTAHAIWGIENKIYMSGVYIDDLLLICWDEEGGQIWNKTWGGSEWEEGFDVWGIGEEIYTSGSTSSFGAGSNDSLIIKWDGNGNQIWNRTWGYSGEEYFTSIFGYNTSLYVCGNVWNENHTFTDAIVMKWDSEGNFLWDGWWGGPDNERAYAIWANEFYVYVSTSVKSWGVLTDKPVLAKWSYSGIYIDSSWPWWDNELQYIPKGLFGSGYSIYTCGWQNFTTPTDYSQFLFNYYSYETPPSPWFEPIKPNPSLNGTYTLEWQYFPEVEYYHVYRDIHPILDISGRTPYQILTNTSYVESGMAEGTYFYVVTTILRNSESPLSNPRVVEVDLPNPPDKIPGYNITIFISFLAIISILVGRKYSRKK